MVTRLLMDGPGFDFWWEQEIFLLSKMSRQFLGPTHPPVQWVLGVISPEVKWPQNEDDNLH
jgi:hypothetical protein